MGTWIIFRFLICLEKSYHANPLRISGKSVMPQKAFHPAVTVTLRRRLSHLGDGAGDSERAVLSLHRGKQPLAQSLMSHLIPKLHPRFNTPG